MTVEDLAKEYEKKLLEIYARANTKSKRKRIAHDLLTFSNICNEHFDIYKTFEWEKDLKIINEIKNYYLPFLDDVAENTKLYNTIFTNVLNTFLNSEYNIYNFYEKKYQTLTEKEKQEILFDFLASYDESLLKDLEMKLENYEIFTGNIHGFSGITYPIQCLNKNLIFCSPYQYDTIYGAQILAHELGHHYEMSLFNSTSKNCFLDTAYTKPYYEISSRFFEYAFLKYLEENKILINDTNKSIDYLMFDLLSRSYNIHLMYMMKKIQIDELDHVHITEKKIIDRASEILNKLNYYSFPYEEGDVIKFRHSFIYGMGDLFSIYLYENYKEDPNNFKKEFRNALLTYPYGDSIKEFERVGVTPEVLIEGKVLKKVLDSMK